MLVLFTIAALLIPASAILLHQYMHRSLASDRPAAESTPDSVRELPRAA